MENDNREWKWELENDNHEWKWELKMIIASGNWNWK